MLLIYRIVMALMLVPLLMRLGPAGHLRERLGIVPKPAKGPRLWLHGASNGELTSARWVLKAVLQAHPDLQVLVTVNTATARAMVAQWALPGVVVAFAPLDTAGAAARVLRRWQPTALVLIENELWPARILAAEAAGAKVLVIGARISPRSARRWQWARGLIGASLDRVTWLCAQDAASRDRFVALGLSPDAAGPVLALKAFGGVDAAPAPFEPPAPRDQTLLAASTHDGEEALILQAFLTSRFGFLILAPRHAKRGPEVANLLSANAVRFAQRSLGQVPGPETQVYLADTMGEMPLWYGMAGACVIGGTFAQKGGHTPWEPNAAGCAIVHGPSVFNFAAPFAALDAAGAAIAVSDNLAQALIGLDGLRQDELAAKARIVLRPDGDRQAFMTALLSQIMPDQYGT